MPDEYSLSITTSNRKSFVSSCERENNVPLYVSSFTKPSIFYMFQDENRIITLVGKFDDGTCSGGNLMARPENDSYILTLSRVYKPQDIIKFQYTNNKLSIFAKDNQQLVLCLDTEKIQQGCATSESGVLVFAALNEATTTRFIECKVTIEPVVKTSNLSSLEIALLSLGVFVVVICLVTISYFYAKKKE